MDEKTLTAKIRGEAEALDIGMVGIISTSTAGEFTGLQVDWDDWGPMASPREYLPDVRSVLVLGDIAFGPAVDFTAREKEDWLHLGYKPLEVKAFSLGLFLQNLGFQVAVAPKKLSYKNMAQAAGLGRFGKNSLILAPDFGPYLRFHCLLTDAELVYDDPFTQDLCGDCQRCLQACPTGALEPYRVNPEKCLVHSLLRGTDSAEEEGLLAEVSPQMVPGAYVMCRRCQEVCPKGLGW